MAILDSAMGFVPMRTPREKDIEHFIVLTANTVYPGQVVTLNAAGLVVPCAASEDGPVLGVCLDYLVGDSVKKVAVCVDPSMSYRVKGDDAFVVTKIGLYADTKSNAGSSVTLKSVGVLDTANATATHAADTVFKIIGAYDVVTPVASPQWYVVKFNPSDLIFGSDIS